MAVNARHPLYEDQLNNWKLLGHCHEGEAAIKAEGETYLPPTSGHVADGMGEGQPGLKAYEAYLARAVFPDDVRESVEGLVGIMHIKPPKQMNVPTVLEEPINNITSDNEDALTLLRRVNAAQLTKGRIGLLVEVPDGVTGDAVPFIATYSAESIINWTTGPSKYGRDEPDVIVLDESGMEQLQDLSWKYVDSYRVLATGAALERLLGARPEGVPAGDVYVVSTGPTLDLAARTWIAPQIKGRTFERIPFVFINVQDLAPDPDRPPLLGLANRCLAIYRAEADYRHSLFMQSQETLVILGDQELDPDSDKDETRIGAGAIIRISNPDGDVKYVGVSGAGLAEQGKALQADYDKAAQLGLKLLDGGEGGGSQQSGEALRIRVAARTASLSSIARAGVAGLAQAVKYVAEWMGASPDDVEFEANTDYAANQMTGEDLTKLVSAKTMGAPISWETIHSLMRNGKLTEKTYEEELDLIADEEPAGGVDARGNPLGDPNADPNDPNADPNAPPEDDNPDDDPNA